MQQNRTLFLIEIAIFSAFAFVLDIIPFLSFKVWPQGGSVSFAMIPIFIIAFRWGTKGGLLAGFLYAILQMTLGTPYILNWAQALLDYPIAFTVLGFAGVMSPAVQGSLKAGTTKRFVGMVTIGVLIGIILRFVAHFLSGIIFFGSVLEVGDWYYSLWYNGSYLLPAFIINVIAVAFLFHKRPKLVAANEKKTA